MKKLFTAATAWTLAVCLFLIPAGAVAQAPQSGAGASLLMERSTGTILYEQNATAHFEPASVTKVMTLLLIMEAIDDGRLSLHDTVTVSAHAASMGGSQVYLEENEQMTVHDLLKATVVVSGNDASVALAEQLMGSEEAFVARMNERAAELGMTETHFVDCTGLTDDANHYSCARDIAIMSRELLGHELIRDYTTIWIDSLRNGEFGLANTNKLVRYYDGTTGLKTGYTPSAGHCLSASAERGGMELIAVILKAPSSAERFEDAKALLNYGFANFALVSLTPDEALPPVTVSLGTQKTVQPVLGDAASVVVPKEDQPRIEKSVTLTESVQAPVKAGDPLGEVTLTLDGEVIATAQLVADTDVARLTVGGIFHRMLRTLFMAG
ncbi:MAG TPA: D-alanyl-D-alanine carboxypeptidase family protein [Oscillospiraceae bacterium]|nr:D-alanyl-D-alanine carboxypeptidase family protein [Oscillospiraceae bacterium]